MKKIHEEIKRVFESKVAFGILLVIGFLIVALLIFRAGVEVGFHKASFGRNWGENYGRNFGMMQNHPIPGFRKDNFPNASGAVGKIIKIEIPSIIVQDKDNTEKVISVTDNTRIQQAQIGMKTTDLKIGDFVVIIGTPNDKGIIDAKFIRLMPAPEFLK
jgi:hypothetical protein